MSFNWIEYLTLAKELVERDDEAAMRSAISRAYYAAYGKARERLRSEGVTAEAFGGDHAALWNAYASSSDDARYYIGLDGNSLRQTRNMADYESEFRELYRRARNAVREAENLVATLDRL